jgi:glycosyltransferase involved in cell wall biosynthesis
MEKRKIIVSHDFDAKKYFSFLDSKYNVEYLTSRPLRHFFADLVLRRKINLYFLNSLIFFYKIPFISKQNIILAMAPGTYRLIFYTYLIKKNNLIHHTSWSKYEIGEFLYKTYFFNNLFKNFWFSFLRNPNKRIVTVLNYGLIALNKIGCSSIYHIPHPIDLKSNDKSENFNEQEINILFVGRLTEEKGVLIAINIVESLHKIDSNRRYVLHILGDGNLRSSIIKKSCSFIKYYGFLSGTAKEEVFKKCQFLLNPSIKTNNWEELFGKVIIEAMSLGIVPISTDHIGPKEIIANKSGFIFPENIYIDETIKVIKSIDESKYLYFSNNAIFESAKFSTKSILSKWTKILD